MNEGHGRREGRDNYHTVMLTRSTWLRGAGGGGGILLFWSPFALILFCYSSKQAIFMHDTITHFYLLLINIKINQRNFCCPS